jgi:hypothetical protein
MEVNLEAKIINVHWEGCDCGGDGREHKCFETFYEPG